MVVKRLIDFINFTAGLLVPVITLHVALVRSCIPQKNEHYAYVYFLECTNAALFDISSHADFIIFTIHF